MRVRKKNKGKRKRSKKVNYRKSIEASSYEHIDLNSNNSNESFLSESWHTEWRSCRIKWAMYPKNLIIGHLNINSVRNIFSSFQQTVLSKTDIFLLSETKIDDLLADSQFFAVGLKRYCKDKTKSGGGLLIYINEHLPGNNINSYKFKENSEILFEFSVSNKKWLLLISNLSTN